jgi:flagellar biosynthesis regulator FlaF
MAGFKVKFIAYDADFFDFDGDNIDEIIITRAKNGMGDIGYYIQILQLVDNDYVDATNTFIDTFYSNDRMWISYIEIRDYDNDGVIELRNNIPLDLQLSLQESGLILEEPYYMDEWELIGNKLIKVN